MLNGNPHFSTRLTQELRDSKAIHKVRHITMSAREQRWQQVLDLIDKGQERSLYPCTQQDANNYVGLKPFDDNRLPLSLVEMACSFSPFLDSFPDPASNMARPMLRLAERYFDEHWGPKTILDVLPDIDFVFFGGHLRGNTVIQWAREDCFPLICGSKPSFGVTDLRDKQRSIVYLNADSIIWRMRDSKYQMWQTALHELIVSSSRAAPSLFLTDFRISTPFSTQPVAGIRICHLDSMKREVGILPTDGRFAG